MRYPLLLLLAAALVSCSDTNAPDAVVESVEICRDCGDGKTVTLRFDNGRLFPFADPIEDGGCTELRLSEWASGELTGSDVEELNWDFEGENSPGGPFRFEIPLSQKCTDIPCP